MSGEPGIDSDDLSDIRDTPEQVLLPPSSPDGFFDTDGIRILYALDTTPGKFHKNMKDLGLDTSWGSSAFCSVDANGNGSKMIDGNIAFYRFTAKEGSFSSGGENRIFRLDWHSSTGGTQCGISGAKSRGYIGRANDTKNCEVTYIFRVRDFISGNNSHFHVSLNPRGANHIESNECTLQIGGRHPFAQRGRHSELYSTEYTHPNYEYQTVTFVSPFTYLDYPLIQNNTWFGIKFIVWNTNNNTVVHTEMWIDDNPIDPITGGFNNNWKKLWIFEHSGNRSPTWSGPNCEARINMASNIDVAAFNIHEIVIPSQRSMLRTEIETAEHAEYERITGNTDPIWIEQISEVALVKDPNTLIPEDQVESAEQQNNLNSREFSQQQQLPEFGARGMDSDQTIVQASPHFVAMTDAVTGIEVDAPKKLIAIKKVTIAKKPKPLISTRDEADQDYIPIIDSEHYQNQTYEEDYQLTDNFYEPHFGQHFK